MKEINKNVATLEKKPKTKNDPLGVIFRAIILLAIIISVILLIMGIAVGNWQFILISLCLFIGLLFVYWVITVFSRIYITLDSIDEKMSKIITAMPEKSETVNTAEIKPATEKTE